MFRRRFFRPLLTKYFKMRLWMLMDSFRYLFSTKRYTTPFLGSSRFVSSGLQNWCENPKRIRGYFKRDSQAKWLKRSSPLVRRMERKFERILVAMYKNLSFGGEFSINNRVVKLHVSGCDETVMNQKALDLGCIESVMNQKALDLGCVVEYLKGKKWTFDVVDTKKLSSASWGGRIAISTRDISDVESETVIASIIGHEIAHVVAQHQNEVFLFMAYALMKSRIPILSKIFDLVFNFQSRRMEFEADHIGLMISALAGYDPRIIVENLLRSKSRKETWLSSHPSFKRRGECLTRPQIMKKAIMLHEEALASAKQGKNALAIEACKNKSTRKRKSIEACKNKITGKRKGIEACKDKSTRESKRPEH